MAEYLPKFIPGQAITVSASAPVTGGQLVEVTGVSQVGPAGADSAKVLGVAGFDAREGDRVTVFRDGVQRLTAAGAISAGAPVYAAADGKVQASGTNRVGLALTSANESGDIVDVAI